MTKLIALWALILSFFAAGGQPPVEQVFNSVYKIKHISGRPSGTAFQIKYAGKLYLISNAHVCGNPKKVGAYKVLSSDNKVFDVRRIGQGYAIDICILTGLKGRPYLTLGESPELGDAVFTMGYPGGRRSFVSGHYQGMHWVIISSMPTYLRCKMTVTVHGCVDKEELMGTSFNAAPGASGSPLLNKYGQVVGVITTTRGDALTNKKLLKVLKEQEDG